MDVQKEGQYNQRDIYLHLTVYYECSFLSKIIHQSGIVVQISVSSYT